MVLAAGTAVGLLLGVEPLGLGLPGVWWALGLLMASRLGTMLWRYQSEDGPLPPSGEPALASKRPPLPPPLPPAGAPRLPARLPACRRAALPRHAGLAAADLAQRGRPALHAPPPSPDPQLSWRWRSSS